MKLSISFNFRYYLVFSLALNQICCDAPPTVSVNYLPKKQWKLSKHDLADIKLDIEREMRSKILQVQMDWENKERMQQNMMYNQYAPIIPNSFFNPSPYPQSSVAAALPRKMNNFPRFNQKNKEREDKSDYPNKENNNETEKMNNLMGKTLDKIRKLKEELKLLKEKKIQNNMINPKENKKIMSKSLPNSMNDIKQTKIHFENNINPNNSADNAVRSIIEKYSVHNGSDELAIFENMFRNYNQTTSNKVDVEEVNRKIHETIRSGKIERFKNFKLIKNDKKSDITSNVKEEKTIKIKNYDEKNQKNKNNNGSTENRKSVFSNKNTSHRLRNNLKLNKDGPLNINLHK